VSSLKNCDLTIIEENLVGFGILVGQLVTYVLEVFLIYVGM